MQASLRAGLASSQLASPCRPASTSRTSLLITNSYGDLPKIGTRSWHSLSCACMSANVADRGRSNSPHHSKLGPWWFDEGLVAATALQSRSLCVVASGWVEACLRAECSCVLRPPLPPPCTGGGRKWKYLKPNGNGNVEALKLHVKKGDFVQVGGVDVSTQLHSTRRAQPYK